MVKSTELRIGNILSLRGGIVTVKGLGINSALHDKGENQAGDLEGIELTEYWLMGFGFRKTVGAEGFYWHKKLSNSKMFKQHFRIGEAGMYFIPFGIDDYQSAEINFVHQLQNIFHALTGEELTLK